MHKEFHCTVGSSRVKLQTMLTVIVLKQAENMFFFPGGMRPWESLERITVDAGRVRVGFGLGSGWVRIGLGSGFRGKGPTTRDR